jgi:hypothetical protein
MPRDDPGVSERLFSVRPRMPPGQSICSTGESTVTGGSIRELTSRFEVSGQRLRVILERDSHHDRRSSHSQTDASALGLGSTIRQTAEQDVSKEQTPATSPVPQTRQTPRLASRVPWQLNLGNQSTPIRGSANGPDSTPRFGSFNPNNDSTPYFRQARHPGPIAMPPHPTAMHAWPNQDYGHPLSPLQTRGLPPMTPSMPGFVFNNSFPDTPPVHHHFMGPFSPGIPITSPNGFGFNPFLNPAPGAPVYRPQMGGSAQLGTPTTQSFPVNAGRAFIGTPTAPGAPVNNQSNGEYFPSTAPPSNDSHMTPPPMPPRQGSQSVLNARDRLAPSAPTSEAVNELGTMAASMSLNSLATGQATPPTPTQGKPRRSASGGALSRLASGVNGNGIGRDTADPLVDSGPSSPVAGNGRFSLDEQRPTLDVDTNGSSE